MEREKSAEATGKQIQVLQIQQYDLVNCKFKWNINPRVEINTIEN